MVNSKPAHAIVWARSWYSMLGDSNTQQCFESAVVFTFIQGSQPTNDLIQMVTAY